MLSNYQKAEAVIAGLEEASPQLLASLAESGQLARKLEERVSAFNLEFVRRMEGQPENRELEVEESVMPLLTEFPPSPDQRPLTPEQRRKVEQQLEQWAESQPQSAVPEISPA